MVKLCRILCVVGCFVVVFPKGVNAAAVSDTFTDTAGTLLENHVSDTGNTWTRTAGGGVAQINAAGRLQTAATVAVDVSSGVPASADYDVSVDIYISSMVSTAGAQTGIGGRSSTSGWTGYWALLNGGAQPNITLMRAYGSTFATYNVTLNEGETHRLMLRMRGNTISVYWDGSQVISAVPTGGDIVSTAGLGGVYDQHDNFHIDNFAMTDALTAGTLSEVTHGTGSATVSWTAATGGSPSITAQLQRSPYGAGTWSNVSGATTSPATDTGLSPLTAYDYRVAYTDAAATTANSNTISLTTFGLSSRVRDTFADTAGTLLENHVSDTGNTWTKSTGGGSIQVTAAGRLSISSLVAVDVSSGVPVSADYDVSADIYINSTTSTAGAQTGVGGRSSASAWTGYWALLNGGAQPTITLQSAFGSALATYNVTLNAGETHHMMLRMRGNTISVYWDGSQVISVDATGADIVSSTGLAGVYIQSDKYHIDNFALIDALAGGTLTEVSHGTGSVTVSWTNATGGLPSITAQLQRSPYGEGTWSNVSGATTSPVTDTGLSPSTAYDYRVAYTDAEPTTAYSNTVSLTTSMTTYTVLQADLWDNGYDNVSTPRQSTFSRFVFTSDAANVTITGTTSIYASYPQYAHLGVRINGVDQSPLVFTSNGSQSFVVSLGTAGTVRTVEVIAGLQSKPTTIIGSYIDSVMYLTNTSFSVQSPTAGNRVLVYGDSIAVGGNATNPETQSYVALLRTSYNQRVMLEGWGYRSLYDDANTSELRSAFVSRIAGYNPATIWLAIGTNDYGLNRWTAASFGSAYAALLDDLHAALPSARIICQTPVVRGSEAANALGNTLGDYRSQITTACSSRSWTTLIDGAAFLTTGDLDDGVHPSTAGQAKYAARIAPVLAVPGYSVVGPVSGIALQQSSAFTVTIATGSTFMGDQTITLATPNGTLSATATGGSIVGNGTASVAVTPANGVTSFTFRFTPVASENVSLTFTNSQGWTNPSQAPYAIAYATSAIVISSSLNPSTVGQSVTFTAIVTPVTATGTVTFQGARMLGTTTLGHGSGSLTTTDLAAGTQTVTASYGGSPSYLGSTSNIIWQVVNGNNGGSTAASGGGGGGGGTRRSIPTVRSSSRTPVPTRETRILRATRSVRSSSRTPVPTRETRILRATRYSSRKSVVIPAPSVPVLPPSSLAGQTRIVGTSLKLHASADVTSTTLTVFDPNTVVQLLSVRVDWAEVQYKRHHGWVVRKYLRK